MFNAVYRLAAPGRFEVVVRNMELSRKEIIVRPTYLSICHADQRYYRGSRPVEILAGKLPMALIHEAVGEVVYDPERDYKTGDSVVLIPNIPARPDPLIAENYQIESQFCASSCDGFMQETICADRNRLVRLPAGIDPLVGVFTELISVSVHAIRRFDATAHARREVVGIWGDGNLGYITAVLFKTIYPKTKLCIFGVTNEKLSSFIFADEVWNVSDIPKELRIDHAFECVGGLDAKEAIAQMTELIMPEGTMSLMGVSEHPVPVNTRKILEKGLKLIGNSRSGKEDFVKTIELYGKYPKLLEAFSHLVGMQLGISCVEDMVKAFEADIQKASGKTIMRWNI